MTGHQRYGFLAIAMSIGVLLGATGCGGDKAQTPAQWRGHWCWASAGMSTAEIRKLMGPPTEDYSGPEGQDGFEPQLIWESGKWQFTAFLDANGRVSSLQANTLGLTAEEKARVECEI